jgi:hypothetical protein
MLANIFERFGGEYISGREFTVGIVGYLAAGSEGRSDRVQEGRHVHLRSHVGDAVVPVCRSIRAELATAIQDLEVRNLQGVGCTTWKGRIGYRPKARLTP